MARLHHISTAFLRTHRPPRFDAPAVAPQWRAARPDAADQPVRPWFALSPTAPVVDNLVGARGLEFSAALATFGGVTEPRSDAATDTTAHPSVILGGAHVQPDAPPGTADGRMRNSSARLRLAAEFIGAQRQCLVVAAVSEAGTGEHYVQSILDERIVAEDRISGDDRIALLFDLPDDGELRIELWLRLASPSRDARLGLFGVTGHLL